MPLPQDRSHGLDWLLYFDTVEPADPFNPAEYGCELECRTEGELTSERDVTETPSTCGTIQTPGQPTQTLDVSAFHSTDPADCVNQMKTHHEEDEDIYWLLTTGVAGEVAFAGLASVSSFTLPIGDEDVQAAFTLNVQGTWTQGVTTGGT